MTASSIMTILMLTGIYTPLASVFGGLILYSAPTTEMSIKTCIKNILMFNGLVIGCTVLAIGIIYVTSWII